MNNQNKYYSPALEDLYIGYECEIGNSGYAEAFHPNGKDWRPIVIGKSDAVDNWSSFPYYDIFVEYADSLCSVRTKYLDKEDILSLGWTLTGEELKQYSHWCNFHTKDWSLSVQLNDKYFPRLLNLRALKHCSWNGNIKIECKSINELRKIMKFINIK